MYLRMVVADSVDASAICGTDQCWSAAAWIKPFSRFLSGEGCWEERYWRPKLRSAVHRASSPGTDLVFFHLLDAVALLVKFQTSRCGGAELLVELVDVIVTGPA